MTSPWQPYREPLRNTLLRTIAIAVILGAIVARWSGGGLSRWPIAALLILWPSFGGHWIELWFLNRVRPRLSRARHTQVAARIGVWFVGGCALLVGMMLTARTLTNAQSMRRPAWWLGGLAFIAIELGVHAALRLRRRPNFYDGRG